MKPLLLFIFIFIFSWNSSAQNFHLQIIGKTDLETKIIDSLNYITKHKNTKSLKDEINKLSTKLSQIGYIDTTTPILSTANDSSFVNQFTLGEKIKSVLVYIGKEKSLNDLISSKTNNNNKIELPYSEIDSFLKETLNKLEQNGYALAKLKLINIERNKNTLSADLKLETEEKRKLNSITIRYSEEGLDKFPKGHLKQINKKYQNTIFNQKTVEQIHNDFEKFNFVNQVKYPEILFTKDTTKVYVYLEKTNSNTFDGFLGFSNNNNKKIRLNGYLDVTLDNILGSGEEFSIYWKSDGNDQKTFKGSFELPYLFKTPVGLKAQINIFRQDSTFQNTKTAIDLSYYINYNSHLYLGYHATESSDIQDSSNTLISDFNNSFITSTFEYTKPNTTNITFPIQTKFEASLGIGNREINNSLDDSKNKQLLISIQAAHEIYLNKRNSIQLKSQNHYLQSNRYITNELFRFGGFNSIRGFAENSLQAYFTSSLLTEYHYILSPNLYIHSILDYSIFKNKTEIGNTDITENLLGFGIGMGVQTKNGLLKLAIANGKNQKQKFETSNTIIHISYNVKF